MCGQKKKLLNLVLSNARYAVKLRRNMAHYEGKLVSVWEMMMRMFKRNISLLYTHMGKEEFMREHVEGCKLIEEEEGGKLKCNFEML